MNRYRVELRDSRGHTKAIHLMADSHSDAVQKAKEYYGLLVLSTEFLE